MFRRVTEGLNKSGGDIDYASKEGRTKLRGSLLQTIAEQKLKKHPDYKLIKDLFPQKLAKYRKMFVDLSGTDEGQQKLTDFYNKRFAKTKWDRLPNIPTKEKWPVVPKGDVKEKSVFISAKDRLDKSGGVRLPPLSVVPISKMHEHLMKDPKYRDKFKSGGSHKAITAAYNELISRVGGKGWTQTRIDPNTKKILSRTLRTKHNYMGGLPPIETEKKKSMFISVKDKLSKAGKKKAKLTEEVLGTKGSIGKVGPTPEELKKKKLGESFQSNLASSGEALATSKLLSDVKIPKVVKQSRDPRKPRYTLPSTEGYIAKKEAQIPTVKPLKSSMFISAEDSLMKADKRPMPNIKYNKDWDSLSRTEKERQWLAQKKYIKSHPNFLAKLVRNPKTGDRDYTRRKFPTTTLKETMESYHRMYSLVNSKSRFAKWYKASKVKHVAPMEIKPPPVAANTPPPVAANTPPPVATKPPPVATRRAPIVSEARSPRTPLETASPASASLKTSPPVPKGETKEKSMFISAKDSLLKSVLSTEDREDLKQKQFALPKKAEDKEEKGESGNYPIPDLSHARNALAMVARYGNSSEQAKVRAAVYKKYPELDKRKEDVKKSCWEDSFDMFKGAEEGGRAKGGARRSTALTEDIETSVKQLLRAPSSSAGDLSAEYKDPTGKQVQSKTKGAKLGELIEQHHKGQQVAQGATVAAPVVGLIPGLGKVGQRLVASAGSRLDEKARGELAKLAGSKEWKTYNGEQRTKLIRNILSKIPIVGGVLKNVTKSLDPALAARQNMKPMSTLGAMGGPVLGQVGFHNTAIEANFSKSDNITFDEKTLRVLKRPNR